jgi:coiled-coil domain-containing protein 12
MRSKKFGVANLCQEFIFKSLNAAHLERLCTYTSIFIMSTSNTLLSASQDRKARLAQLRSLKRKEPEPDTSSLPPPKLSDSANDEAFTKDDEDDVTSKYLSGRNFDATSRTVKLGFEHDPTAGAATLEQQAAAIAEKVREEAAANDGQADEPLDLFRLQPKKPNWDLKRELAQRMAVLDVRTENAIARLVRERIEGPKRDGAGIEGVDLVEAVHVKEREEEEDERREREWESTLADG